MQLTCRFLKTGFEAEASGQLDITKGGILSGGYQRILGQVTNANLTPVHNLQGFKSRTERPSFGV